jgi:undecaprenyl-diphosphatase
MVLARLGDGLLWLAIALFVLAFGSSAQKAALGPIVLAVLLTTLGVAAIKLTLRRTRPLGAASARWSALPKYDIHSFPSGHAARLACISVGLGTHYPLAGLVGVALTILVSLARVALGIHYLLDVLMGGLWGGIVAALILAT